MVARFQEGVPRGLPDGDLLGSHPAVTGGKVVLAVTDPKQMQSEEQTYCTLSRS